MKMTRIFGVISNENDKDIWCDTMAMTRIFGVISWQLQGYLVTVWSRCRLTRARMSLALAARCRTNTLLKR